MKNVIVTGANGFVGTALVSELSARGIHIVAVVRNQNSDVSRIASYSNVTIVPCEMENIDTLPALVSHRGFDACFHLAWEGSYGPARADYEMQLRNVRFTLDMVNIASQLGVKRFVGIGTLAERDVANYVPKDGATPAPVSIYGIAKLTAHYMVKAQCAKNNMDYIWCCLSNIYGVGNTTNNFVNMASRKMLQGQRAAFTTGEQMYDFLYISDAARALADAAMYGRPATDYFLGSTSPRKLKKYILQIRNAIDPEIPLYLGEVPFYGTPLPADEFNTDKLVQDTAFAARVSFEQGIEMTLEWLKKENQ